MHDPSATEPRCRLQDEDNDDYGPVIPEANIAEAIRERTEVHLRKLGATVSSKVSQGTVCLHGPVIAGGSIAVVCAAAMQPIVMRAEFSYAPNLTIVDTPGFILKVTCCCEAELPCHSLAAQSPDLRSWRLHWRRHARERQTAPPMTFWRWSRHR